jgi:hypothetical protein
MIANRAPPKKTGKILMNGVISESLLPLIKQGD